MKYSQKQTSENGESNGKGNNTCNGNPRPFKGLMGTHRGLHVAAEEWGSR